ncbi:MAG: hypothetical protein AAFP02_13520, partial [Bacteroidota bacterium]
MFIRLILCSMLLAGLIGCQRADKKAQAYPEAPNRRQVMQALGERGQIMVIYAATDSVYGERYRTWFEEKAQQEGNLKIIVKADTAVTEEEWKNEAIFLCGTFGEHRILRQIADHLPYHIDTDGFRFLEKRYAKAEHTLSLSFLPHPFQLPLPVALLAGNQDSAVWDQLSSGRVSDWRGMPWGRWSFQIYEGEERKVMGMYDEEWQLDPTRYWSWEGGAPQGLSSEHFQFHLHHQHLSEERLEALREACEQRYQQIEAWVGKSSELAPIQFHLYEEAEAMGLQHNRMEQGFVDYGRNAAYALLNDDYKDNFWEPESRLLLNHLLGSVETRVLEEGLAVYFAERWQKYGWSYWSNKLAGTGLILPLSSLVNNNAYQQQSTLIKTAYAGALIEFLLEEWGKEAFLKAYPNWEADKTSLAELEPKWQAFHQKRVRNFNDEHR